MSDGYDRALTVFSPDGHLLQVEYAGEAVRRGACASGIVAQDSVLIGVERRAAVKLQEPRTLRKINKLDESIVMAFAGLQADARVLINQARVECQSYRLSMEVEPSVDYIAQHIARIKQKFTILGGRRPFGISALIGGFTSDEKPRLLLTEQHGILTSWKAHAIGRNAKVVEDYFEKNITETPTKEEALKLIVSALFETVEVSKDQTNIEVVQVTRNNIEYIDEERIAVIVRELEALKQEKAAESLRERQ